MRPPQSGGSVGVNGQGSVKGETLQVELANIGRVVCAVVNTGGCSAFKFFFKNTPYSAWPSR